MKHLSAQDAAFLYMETPDTPMHIGSLTIFGPTTLPGEAIFASFRDHTVARLDALPYYRRRLHSMPLEIDHPVWIDTDTLDLSYHLRHSALPAPGGMAQLHDLVAELHQVPLDRAQPLWQCHVIHGLEGGGFALYMKVHHATMDGVAAMLTLPTTFDFTPEPDADFEPPPQTEFHDREPGPVRLLGVALDDFVQQDMRIVKAVPRLLGAAVNVGRRAATTLRVLPPALTRAPRTKLNVSISNDRIFTTLTLKLTEVKLLGKARQATINDVVMAVCAGGLRRYLANAKALPRESLTAAVPVSLRGAGQTEMNNQSGMILCDLATNLADPLERLAAIAASARDARNRFVDIQGVWPTELAIPGAPLVLKGVARLAGRGRILDWLPPMMNVLISNVPGPRQPMYCAGTAAVHHFPISIPFHRCALNITVLSYLDCIDFGLIACRATVPDVQRIADHIEAEFESLKRAAGAIADSGSVETIELHQPRRLGRVMA